jgi:hypothetical protein
MTCAHDTMRRSKVNVKILKPMYMIHMDVYSLDLLVDPRYCAHPPSFTNIVCEPLHLVVTAIED